ncbi:hypothetical protein OROHE_023278 [Orobanche hederae]
MALQSGTVVVTEKLPIQWYNNHQLQPPYHQMDEREAFVMWLRGEFAAANAIIDALCHHLRAVGGPGEYDGVIMSIQQRRCNWNPVLHMQQFFSVAEVVYSLQQVSWKRQQQHRAVEFEGSGRIGGGGKDFRREGRGQRGGTEVHSLGGEVNGKDLNNGYGKSNSNVDEKLKGEDKAKVGEKKEKKDSTALRQETVPRIVTRADDEAVVSCHTDGSEIVIEEKINLQLCPRTFVSTEICEGRPVNIAEGVKLYEDLFDDSEILKLGTLVNDLRASGRSGQLKGQAFVTLKRPMRGHGREIIQLGIPIADARPDDEAAAGASKDIKIEPIPELLQDVIEQLLTEKVVSVKPDSIIIDFFNEGDYSQPYIWPHSFGKPVCVLFLTECEMSFGKVMSMDHPGHYRGALQLSLSPGSMLVVQGKSADFTRHAISSQRKQRIIITLVKSQPKKVNASDVHHFPPTQAPPSNWVPTPSRSPSHTRVRPIPPPGVLPPPTTSPQVTPLNNGIQPVFLPSHVTPAIAFPAPVAITPASAGWAPGPPRHPPPHRLPAPGTGVFLPPQGSGNSSNPSASILSTGNITVVETIPAVSEENGTYRYRSNDVQVSEQERNGSASGGSVVTKEEVRENSESEEEDRATLGKN